MTPEDLLKILKEKLESVDVIAALSEASERLKDKDRKKIINNRAIEATKHLLGYAEDDDSPIMIIELLDGLRKTIIASIAVASVDSDTTPPELRGKVDEEMIKLLSDGLAKDLTASRARWRTIMAAERAKPNSDLRN